MLWTVIASTDHCKIYEFDRKNKELHLIKQLIHPESRKKDQDLVSDKPGHYKSHNFNRGAFIPDTSPKEVVLEEFARQIANELDLARSQNQYKNLVLISQPKMMGLIQKANNAHVKNLILETINKDNIHFTESEIIDELTTALRRPKI